jgi:methionyl-tRNA synthetase
MQYRKALQTLKAIWTQGNTYFDRMEPWKTIKSDTDRTACTLRTAINLVRIYAIAAFPIIPFTSERVLDALGIRGSAPAWFTGNVEAELHALPPGHAFEIPPPLFAKIADEQIEAWQNRFGGVPAPTG